ncbi:phage major capsid protein [Alteromonas gracilis]|uniref:phage major capsid protein n=1 Tax=Alteromonas gracilis TaxID=1479524 RepID=UPI0030D3CF17
MNEQLQTAYQARNLQDLIENAKPEQIPKFDDKGDYKGMRTTPPAVLKFGLDDSIVTKEELAALPEDLKRHVRTAMMDTANSSDLTGTTPRNSFTWRHVIVSANVLRKAGMSIDTSGTFEGKPFIGGFETQVATEWLGENAEIPESSPATVNFPYEIHSIGAFTVVSRRLLKLVPGFIPQLQIAQANAIKEATEIAFIKGDPDVNPNQPKGLLNLVENAFSGAGQTGRLITSNVLYELETNGLDLSEISMIMSPDVARKFRHEIDLSIFPTLDVNKLGVSKHMPNGTLVGGRFSDFVGVTGKEIEFLAHTYTPKGEPEAGKTRVRSIFDVDCLLLNQDSFVKVTNIG